jgi:hypothetical protein
MTNLINKSADIIPIGGKKLARPEHDIPTFPCHPKTLSTISEISAIKDINDRAEQCALAGINAEHQAGRTLLESCSEGTSYCRDICLDRLKMYQDLQAFSPPKLRTQFRGLITQTLQYLNDDQDCEYMNDRLYLLCNFLRNDRAIVPRELCDAIRTLRDVTGMTVLWSEDETPSYGEAARWLRRWLQDPELDDVFLLPNQIT